ncbi:MAG: T9SS type A sorting domain-containing protein [Bacteroidota bacterium]
MKRIPTLLLSFLLPCILFSQNAFIKYYGKNNTWESGEQIVATADGHFIVAGIDQTTSWQNNNYFLTKLNGDGEEIWTKVHATFQHENYLNSLITTNDGGFLLGGCQSADIFSDEEAYVVKTNAGGNVEWSSTYGFGEVTDVQQVADGGYVVALDVTEMWTLRNSVMRLDADGEILWQTDPGGWSIESILVTPEGQIFYIHGTRATMLNADGSLDWEISYAPPGTASKAAAAIWLGNGSILILSDETLGNYIYWLDLEGQVLGRQMVDDEPYPGYLGMVELDNGDLVLMNRRSISLYDQAGNFLSETFFREGSLAQTTSVKDLALAANSDIAVTGFHRNPDHGFDPFVARLSPDLEVDWLVVTGDHLPDGYEVGWTCREDVDGSLVIVASRSFPGTKNDFYLVKTNDTGQVLWEANYGNEEDESCTSLVLLADGGYLLAGRRYNYDLDIFQLMLIKTDTDGHQVWEKFYDYSEEKVSDDVIAEELPNGELVLIFSLFGEDKRVFMRTDAQGDSLFTKIIGPGIRNEEVKLTADGHLLLTGYINDGSIAAVDKLDVDGNAVFSTAVHIDSASYGRSGNIEETADGGALVQSNVRFAYRDTVVLTRLDANGTVEWSKLFSPTENGPGQEIYLPRMTKTTDGNFLMSIVSFNERYLPDGNLIYLIKVDEQGNELWSKSFEHELIDEAVYDVQSTSDGGLLMTGNGRNFASNGFDILLIKTLNDGTVHTSGLSFLGEMRLSPNPSAGSLLVNFTSAYTGPLSVDVYNNNGQLLRHFELEKRTAEWQAGFELHELSTGHYFVRLSVNGRSIARTWIKN